MIQFGRTLHVALVPGLAIGLACGLPGPEVPGPIRAFETDTLLIRTYTRFLADDLLAGRATGSTGAEIAARYIRSACQEKGLSPVGGEYLHSVPAVEAAISQERSRLVLAAAGTERVFRYPSEFTPYAANTGLLRGFEGTAVLVGTDSAVLAAGPNASDLQNAVAVSLGTVTARASEILERRGARGIIQLIPDARAFSSRSDGRPVVLLSDINTRSSIFPTLPSIIAGPHAARTVAELLGVAQRSQSTVLLPTFTAKVEIEFSQRPISSNNIACLLPPTAGEEPREAIVLTAHYDHLGIGEPDVRGDSLYNGFSDNAAGVAMLLAIADALKRSERPRSRPVLLLFFIGEELGLLGSDFYVEHPAWPLDSVDAVVNLDAGAPPARPWSWRIAGGDSSALGLLATDVAMARGWSATTSAARANSDYYPFWAAGVPAIFIVPGPGPYEGLTADSSQALRKEWDRYHQPGDEWRADFPFEGLGRYADYALAIVRALQETETLPRLAPLRRVK